MHGHANTLPEGLFQHPDLSAVARLMRATWDRPCWDYDEGLLRSYIDRPGGSPDLCLASRERDRLTGFLAYIPYMVRFDDHSQPIVFASFWTARPDAKDPAVAMKLHRVLTEMAQQAGFQGMLTIIPAKLKATRTVQLIFRRMGLALHPIAEFQQHMTLTRRIQKRLSNNSRMSVVRYRDGYSNHCQTLIAKSLDNVDLARLPEPVSLNFILKERAHTRTWIALENETPVGMLNVIHANTLSSSGPAGRQAQVEYYCPGLLDTERQIAFWASVLEDRFWKDIQAIHLPPRGAVSESIIEACGFIKAPSHYNLFYASYGRDLAIDTTGNFDLDVF